MTYNEMKQKHQTEVNEFPKFAAFNEKQFAEGMQSLGLDPSEQEKILSVGAGMFIRKTDRDAFVDMFKRQRAEIKQACASDQSGDGFIFDMFYTELANHEYSYTGDLSEGIAATPFTVEEINADVALRQGLAKAAKAAEADV